MNWNDILQIILIPLFISIFATLIIELFRHLKKDNQITCRTLSIRHYKEKESGDVSISLAYKNERVGDSIVVATVMLVNTGRKDITFKQVFEDKIGIAFKNASIIDVIVQGQSDRVASKVDKVATKDGFDWFLSWGILKKKEKIILRIVAVCQNSEDSPIINNVANDLSFVFRGDDINGFEFATPFHIRAVRNVCLVAAATLVAILFLVPTATNISYNVKVNGITYENINVQYNYYTHEYKLAGKGMNAIHTKQIDSITIPEQAKMPEDMITACIVVGLYLILLFIFYWLYKKARRERFVEIVRRLFFPFGIY